MIKENKIKVKFIGSNIKYYRNLGYVGNFKDEVCVDIIHLQLKSKYKITAICDDCGREKKVEYGSYNKILNSDDSYYCKKCFYNHFSKDYKNTQLNKRKETCLNKYGVEHYQQTTECKNKIKNTNFKKYGVTHHMQVEECLIKQQISGLKIHKFKNTNLYYQGSYELDFLEKFYNKYKIENGKRFEYYTTDGKKHYYFSDFYLPELKLIIEIKSDYTLKKELDKNFLKQAAVLKSEFDFMFIINKEYKNI